MSSRHSVSVAGAVTDDQGHFLAIERADNGHWEPPGGVLESGETIEAGVAREVLEETGLTVHPTRITGLYQNLRLGVVAIVMACTVVAGELVITEETRSAAWLTLDEVHERMTPAYACRLADALSPTPEPALRAHDGTHLLVRTGQ